VWKSAVRSLALLAAVPLLALPSPVQADVTVASRPPAVLPSSAYAGATTTTGAAPARTLMSQLVTMTNQRRHAAGCGQLRVDQSLIVASVWQSTYMAITGDFSHIGAQGSTFVARARAAGYAQPAGENIAWGYATARRVMDAWMASPSHRANILNCAARSIGTGVSYAANGTPYYAQEFGWL
jgi:uncharacterized protein YkwD